MKLRISATPTRRSVTARKRAVVATRPGVALGIKVGRHTKIRLK